MSKWGTLAAVVLGIFMLLLDVTIVTVALPYLRQDFGASVGDVQWVVDAYALSLAALLLTAGSVADAIGRRKVFATGVIAFVAGSVLCGAATSATFLSLARAAQGVGGAIMFATSLALLSNAYEGKDRGTAFGVFGAATGVALALGPLLGGAIVSALSWRWIFFLNVPVGAVALVITLSRVQESREANPWPVDLPGLLTFSAGLTGVVFGLIRAGSQGWGATQVVAALVAGGVLLAAFVAVEMARARPMLDLSLLRRPAFLGATTSAIGISAAVSSLYPLLSLYFQSAHGYSAMQVGLRFLPLTLAIFVAAGPAGKLSNTIAPRWLIGPGFALSGVGLLLLRGLDGSSPWTDLLPGLIVIGLGSGLISVPLASLAVAVVEPARAGMASGISATARQVGVAGGVAVFGTLYGNRVDDLRASGPAAAGAGALSHVALIAAIIAFVAAVLAFLLIDAAPESTEAGHEPPASQDLDLEQATASSVVIASPRPEPG
jgi:EmrB/QacA subfamily drug resistance transporter